MIIRSPNESPAHLALRSCLPPTITEKSLREFLWEINAHSDLIAFLLVCQNIREVLSLAMEDWESDLAVWELEHWPPILEWAKRDSQRIAREVGGKVAAEFEGNKHPLMSKGIERYPVYAAMCNSQEQTSKDITRSFRLLQAHLLIAHVLATRELTELDEFEKHSGEEELLKKRANPYFAAKAVRQWSKFEFGAFMSELPVDRAPDEFLEKIYEITPKSREATNRLRDLILFLEKAVGEREQLRREGCGRGGGFGERIHGGKSDLIFDWELADPDDKNQNQSKHSTVRRVKITPERRDELLDVDDYPFDDVEDELGTSDFDEKPFQKNPGAFQEASTAQLNHVVMANQMFPWSYGTLALAELRELLQRTTATSSVASGEKLSPHELDELEMSALISVMFWTGSSLERARSLSNFGLPVNNKDVDLAFLPGNEGGIPKWRIAAPLPKYRRPQPEVPLDMTRSPNEYLELPDVAGASGVLLELIKQQAIRDKENEAANAPDNTTLGRQRAVARVFRRRKAWYETELKKLLARLDPESRLTRTRISNYLFSQLMYASKNNLLAAAIITGRDLPLARVRLFYACPSVRKLQQIYVSTVRDIRAELDSIAGLKRTQSPAVLLDSKQEHITNRLCPTVHTVKYAISELLGRVSTFSQYRNDDEFCLYHNYYTLYTVLMFSYCTGIRGIHTPYIAPNEIFEYPGKQAVAVVTDKDSGLGYKAKLAWIGPSLIQHMLYYDDFISRSPRRHEAPDLPCFFLGTAMTPVPVRPKTLAEFTEDFIPKFLPFPANIHRRFVSSELLDRGCPAEVVEAWMGHWHRGEEWWGPSSSLSFKQYREALQVHLVPLLEEEIGFRAIKGFSKIRVHQ